MSAREEKSGLGAKKCIVWSPKDEATNVFKYLATVDPWQTAVYSSLPEVQVTLRGFYWS